MKTRQTLCALAALAIGSSAYGVDNPAIETFSSGAGAWRGPGGLFDAAWHNTGGPGNSGYVSVSYTLTGSTAGDVPVVIQALASANSSDGVFFGDWVAAGITGFSFHVRQDSGLPLTIFARFAGAGNFPGATAIALAPVESGVWTSVFIPISPASPNFISFEGTDFNTVFGGVGIGRVQFGFMVPADIAGSDAIVSLAIDNVAVVPAPGAIALLGLGALAAGRRRR